MCHERDPSIVTALGPALFFVQHYDRGTLSFPLRRPRPISTTMARTCSSIRWFPSRSPLDASYNSSARHSLGPTNFRFDTLAIVSSTSKVEGQSSRTVPRDHTFSSSTILGPSVRDFVLSEEVNYYIHRSRISPMPRSKLPSASFMY